MKNKWRLLSTILAISLLIHAFSVTASAEGQAYTPEDGATLDISACSGDTITIVEGRSVTLMSSSAITLTNVQIICEAGAKLTLQNVVINNSDYSDACPLTFTGTDSKLRLEIGTTSTLTGGNSVPGISIESSAELIVENNGSLTVAIGTTTWDGSGCAGLQCPYGATLTISGEGTLNAKGNNGGSGIGAGKGAACGSITIESGTVNATGGGRRATKTYYHAIDGGVITISGGTVNSANTTYGGIGGNSNEGSSISITGGTVTATAGPGAIGIGGIGSLGCDVTITGGTVTATSNKIAPIGRNNTSLSGTVTITGGTVTAQSMGGNNGGIECCLGESASGTVTITGGTVTATGCGKGAGICGSGVENSLSANATGTGSVTISGGTVTATGGTNDLYSLYGSGICGSSAGTGSVTISGGTVYAGGVTCDLGSGLADAEETLSITGTAMVFLQNNNCTAPATTTHTNFTYPIGTTEVYGTGISVPYMWTTDFSAYLRPCTLSYDVNGGSSVSSITQDYNTIIETSPTSTKTGCTFQGWYTEEALTNKVNFPYTIMANVTLYAKWTAESSDGSDYTPVKTIAVTESNSSLFSDSDGKVKAEANMSSAFSNSVEVKITNTDEKASGFGFSTGVDVYPFDISLYIKETNTKTEPKDGYAVTISLPVPNKLLKVKELLSILHKSDDGNVASLESRLIQIKGVWYLVFEATKFSPYALVVNNNYGVIKSLSGNDFALMFNFNYSDYLSGKAQIQVYVGIQYAGDMMSYYYYNTQTGELEYIQSAAVDTNGYITVKQSTCSSNALVPNNGDNETNNIPQTGENESGFHWWLLSDLSAVGIVALNVFSKRKRENKR